MALVRSDFARLEQSIDSSWDGFEERIKAHLESRLRLLLVTVVIPLDLAILGMTGWLVVLVIQLW